MYGKKFDESHPKWKNVYATVGGKKRLAIFTVANINGKSIPSNIRIFESVKEEAESEKAMKAITRAYTQYYNPSITLSVGTFVDQNFLTITGWRDVSSNPDWANVISELL